MNKLSNLTTSLLLFILLSIFNEKILICLFAFFILYLLYKVANDLKDWLI